MCGIFGIFNYNNSLKIDSDKVKESATFMNYRGPDAYGQWGIENRIELAHCRLSIIDLNPESNQPFISNCKNYVITFNGEIYNYLELKNELEQLGISFRTSSDTEVLLNSYIVWGEDCVSKFNGDWAFCIYNIKEDIFFCSRDRFGVKPFNYSLIDGQLVFSSAIKCMLNYFPQLKVPNYNIISNFCRNSLGAQVEDTWFLNVKRLMPAHNLVIKNGIIKKYRYWEYPKTTFKDISFEDAKERYKVLFFNAVKLRMRSDVPVGTTLSSGLDSSSIVSVLRKFYQEEHNTFTAVFKSDEFDNLEKSVYSKNIDIDEGVMVTKLSEELNLKSHLISISNINFCKELSDLIYLLESGHDSPAIVPLSKIMDVAKENVSVVMEGQGADELLAGYFTNVFPTLLLELIQRGKINQAKREFIEFRKTYSVGYSIKLFFRLLNNDFIERIYYLSNGMSRIFGPKLKKYKRLKDYPSDPMGFNSQLNRELYKSHTGVLVNLLHYGDAISLSRSIESRLPFMDVNLVEFSFQLPYNYKMHNGYGKYIHRQAMKDIVPPYVLENRLKFGFNTPISQYFESIDSDANRILLSKKCIDRGIYNSNGIIDIIKDHISGKRNNSPLLFRLLTVELWFRHFID